MTDQHNTAAARDTPGRPAPTRQHVTGALYVDLDGVRARYECLLCRTTEGPVSGAETVAVFVETVRPVHRARCAATPQEHRQ